MRTKKLEKNIFETIFSKGSTTYSKSSLFFSKEIYNKVMIFYSFVRIVDNFVDLQPKQNEAFFFLKKAFYDRIKRVSISAPVIIERICTLIEQESIPVEYFDAFWCAMEADLQETYIITTMEDCKKYMYGSADIIGLTLCRICHISDEAKEYAALLGSCMQYVNFIRDIGEDYSKNRQYIPIGEYTFQNLSKQEAMSCPHMFEQFIRKNLDIYAAWLQKAQKGLHYLPKRMLIPIVTAVQGYHYIAQRIYKNPFLVYEKKVRPKKHYILFKGIMNCFIVKKRLVQQRLTLQ